MLAYITRTRWEAEIQAVALAKVLGGAGSPGEGGGYQEVPLGGMLAQMGVVIG